MSQLEQHQDYQISLTNENSISTTNLTYGKITYGKTELVGQVDLNE